jgi:hypothetical protein
VLGAIIAPLSAIAALVNAPLQNLYGLIDARIEQLQGQGGSANPPEADSLEAPPAVESQEPELAQQPEAGAREEENDNGSS